MNEIGAVVVGVLAGILAGIPTSVLILVVLTRRGQAVRIPGPEPTCPPVVIVEVEPPAAQTWQLVEQPALTPGWGGR